MPCMVGLILVREPLVRTLFDYGKFKDTADADSRVALALAMYTAGLWAYGLNQVIIRAFYAMQNAKTPLKIAVWNVLLNLALNLILVQTSLRESGLALATALSAAVQFVVLFALFRKQLDHLTWSPVIISAARTLLASAVMGLGAWVAGNLDLLQDTDSLRLLAMVTAGGVAYLVAVCLLRCQEVRELLRR